MDRMKRLFQPRHHYEPLDSQNQHDEHPDREGGTCDSEEHDAGPPFSWLEYSIFLLLGIAMLWAWNMFLAAAPYFQRRFKDDIWILNHFQPAEITAWTMTNFITMLILSKLQKNASYSRRIIVALMVALVTFTLLALSTLVKTSAKQYFGYLLATILVVSLSTGMLQNGVFAFTSNSGRSEYTQAIMTGQGIAGVLPPLVQIISVKSVPAGQRDDVDGPAQSPKAAFIYFLTAVAILIASLAAFVYLMRQAARHPVSPSAKSRAHRAASVGDILPEDLPSTKANKASVPLLHLFNKLRFLSVSVVFCFAVTMVYPVFTISIASVSGIDAAVFIPLAFLLWNTGDLIGRLVTISPKVSLTHYPFALFCMALARLVFVPLYFLCNIKARGAVVESDLFYLVVVQFMFGLSNGYLGSQCMMGANDWVLPEERAAAGGYMGMMLIGGLALGSVLSFLFGDI